MPPPRVYMQVSRSGQIRTPYIQASSPMLTTAVRLMIAVAVRNRELAETEQALHAEQKRAPPIPPTRTVAFTDRH